MKKFLFAIMFFVVACHSWQFDVFNEENDTKNYAEWDGAVRADTNVPTMFVSAPRKIEKPLDMYMAMALALKYNYTRRMISYEQSILQAGGSLENNLPEILSRAGYINDTNSSHLSPDLKVGWNLLDMSIIYYQTMDSEFSTSVAFEQSRKVIHNIVQEVRVLYWKTLTAQRLIPVIDDMTEFMVLEVDELNSKAYELSEKGQSLTSDELKKKRDYMEEVKKLSSLRREMETSETRLASLMGFHPGTEYKLVGKEYGNFALPSMRNNLTQLEWLALNNRPELKVHELLTEPGDSMIKVKGFEDPGQANYRRDPSYYNSKWAKSAKEISMTILEDVRSPNESDMRRLRRERMTSLVLSQVYVSWALVMSSTEDYQIAQEIADTSENIAEDTTVQTGAKDMKSHLEASRAIADEAKAFLAYVDVQEALGNLYATIGLDALPYFMLNEKPSKIAVYLRHSLEKWRNGDYLPDNRPYLLNIPSQRPPVNLSSTTLLPDITVETGQRVKITIPSSIIDEMDLQEKIISRAGLQNDNPLPKWLTYNDQTFTLSGVAMPSNVGTYPIKIYIADSKGNVGYVTFKIKVIEVYVPSIRVQGLTEGRKATVLKRCVGQQCTDNYIDASTVGEEIEFKSR